MNKLFTYFSVVVLLAVLAGCKTKSELRREQEFEHIKSEVQQARTTRADLETVVDDMKSDVTRLSNVVEDQTQLLRTQNEELKKEIATLNTRLQALEQRAAAEEASAKAREEGRSKQTYENGRKLYDEEKYDEAIEILKGVVASKPKSEDARRSQLLVADCYFASKDFASAALEYGEFKKSYPKDAMVPNATYRQAQSFKNLNKKSEAKLFYQELVDRFPKSPLAAKAKAEMKKLK